MGLWFGGSVVDGVGIQALLATSAPAWGMQDPVFAHDLSFYVFQLPLLRTAITFAMVVMFLVFAVCLGGYAATGALRWGPGNLMMGALPRVHLGALVAAFLGLIAVRLWIGRYLLLGTSEVQEIFGFTDAQARLPALQIMTGVTLVAAGAVFWGAWKNRVVPAAVGLGAVVLGGILGVQFYPSLVQRFRVEPNQLSREAPYIEHNIRFTRLGFGLDDLERDRFRYSQPPGADWQDVIRQLDALPVWAGDPPLVALQQMEARFRYYDFPSVSIDRYPGTTGTKVVALAVREVEPAGIEDPNWQNLHLRERYLSGMGVVAIDAADRSPEGQPIMILSGIPPEFRPRAENPEALGEFKRLSQHLKKEEELRWRQPGADGRIELYVRRCVHPVVPRWDAGSIGRGSGRKSLAVCRARKRPWPLACLPLSGRAGFANVGACHLSISVPCRGVIYRS